MITKNGKERPMSKKTLEDFKELKNVPMKMFGNMHDYYVANYENNIISKMDGKERNRQMLEDYDDEVIEYIESLIR